MWRSITSCRGVSDSLVSAGLRQRHPTAASGRGTGRVEAGSRRAWRTSEAKPLNCRPLSPGNAGTALFTVDAASYVNLGRRFGGALPGIWPFAEGGKLWGVDGPGS